MFILKVFQFKRFLLWYKNARKTKTFWWTSKATYFCHFFENNQKNNFPLHLFPSEHQRLRSIIVCSLWRKLVPLKSRVIFSTFCGCLWRDCFVSFLARVTLSLRFLWRPHSFLWFMWRVQILHEALWPIYMCREGFARTT